MCHPENKWMEILKADVTPGKRCCDIKMSIQNLGLL